MGQEEDCDENFRKSCFIEYEQIAFNETAEVCRTPLVKDCDVQGPEICRTEYESECWTKQEVHDVQDDVVECETIVEEKCEDNTSGYTTTTDCSKWPKEVCKVSKKQVKKYTPITACTKEPRELCAPSGCGFTEGQEECFEKVQTVVQDAPKEQCTLEPQRTCKHVTKLVPKLEPVEECVDVPKEVCTRSRTNPGRSRSPWSRNGAMCPQRNLGSPSLLRCHHPESIEIALKKGDSSRRVIIWYKDKFASCFVIHSYCIFLQLLEALKTGIRNSQTWELNVIMSLYLK